MASRVDISGPKARLVRVWDAGLGFSDALGSPFVIVDPSTRRALVWAIDGIGGDPAVRHAWEALTCALMFLSDAVPGNGVGRTPQFAAITGAGQSIFVGTSTGAVACTNVPPTLKIILDQTTFGQDEVEVHLAAGGPFPAGWVVLDGYRPRDLGLNQGNLKFPPANLIPSFTAPKLDGSLPPTVVTAISNMIGTPKFVGSVIPVDSNLPDAPQSFLFPFSFAFGNDGGYLALKSVLPEIKSTAVIFTASLKSSSNSAQITLVTGEDPRFHELNLNDPKSRAIWLSFDLRVFKVTVPRGSSVKTLRSTMTSNPADAPGFIASVLTNMSNGDFESLS